MTLLLGGLIVLHSLTDDSSFGVLNFLNRYPQQLPNVKKMKVKKIIEEALTAINTLFFTPVPPA